MVGIPQLYKHKMLRNVIDNIRISINIFDKNGKRIFVNPYYYHLAGKKINSGFAPEFNGGESHRDKDAALMAKVWESIRTGRTFETHNYSYRSNRKNTQRYFDILIGPIKDGQGEITGAYSIAKDETSRFLAKSKLDKLNQELEKKVQDRTQKIEKAHKKLKKMTDEKKMLVSHVAHEIKTILTIIKGNIDIMMSELMDKEPLVEDCNAEIQREVMKMSKIVSDLVFITKSEVYANLFKIEKIDLKSVMRETINKHKILEENKHFKIILTTDSQNKIYLMADKLKIISLVDNMIENAIKYGKKIGGKLVISVKKEKDHVKMIFKDNGIGIEKEKVEYIFDPFFQVKKTNDLKYNRGFGLGLAICKKIIAAHKGKIDVQSELRKGTIFSIELPLK